jgi:hypothetical protein
VPETPTPPSIPSVLQPRKCSGETLPDSVLDYTKDNNFSSPLIAYIMTESGVSFPTDQVDSNSYVTSSSKLLANNLRGRLTPTGMEYKYDVKDYNPEKEDPKPGDIIALKDTQSEQSYSSNPWNFSKPMNVVTRVDKQETKSLDGCVTTKITVYGVGRFYSSVREELLGTITRVDGALCSSYSSNNPFLAGFTPPRDKANKIVNTALQEVSNWSNGTCKDFDVSSWENMKKYYERVKRPNIPAYTPTVK